MAPRKRKTSDPGLPPGWGEVTLSPAAAAFGAAFEGLAHDAASEPAAGSITAAIMALDPRLSALDYAERTDAILKRVVAQESALALAVDALTEVMAPVRVEGTNGDERVGFLRCHVCGHAARGDVPIVHGAHCIIPRLTAMQAKITEVSA